MNSETMICCDEYLFGKISHNLSYEDLVLANGLANSIRSFSYCGTEVQFPCGRWNIDFLNILNDMHIEYRVRKVSDLLDCSCFNHFIVLVPKEFLTNFKKLNLEVVQIGIVYSAFQIVEREGKNFQLRLSWNGNTENITMSIEQLKILETLKTRPLGNTLKIIEVQENEYGGSKKIVFEKMVENLKKCLVTCASEYEGCHCVSGPLFYDLFVQSIHSMSEMDSKSISSRVCRHLFVSSLNAGGEAFFRSAFFNWYVKYRMPFGNIPKSYLEKIEWLIKLWHELCRKMRFWKAGNYAKEKVPELVDLIQQIKPLELEIVQFIVDMEEEKYDL